MWGGVRTVQVVGRSMCTCHNLVGNRSVINIPHTIYMNSSAEGTAPAQDIWLVF